MAHLKKAMIKVKDAPLMINKGWPKLDWKTMMVNISKILSPPLTFPPKLFTF